MSAGRPSTDREVLLARGFLALLRTHESAGDPALWELSRADWGDGRETIELHSWSAPSGQHRTRGLVCQFRPDDIDGTIELAEACVASVQAAADIAPEVLRASYKPAAACKTCGGGGSVCTPRCSIDGCNDAPCPDCGSSDGGAEPTLHETPAAMVWADVLGLHLPRELADEPTAIRAVIDAGLTGAKARWHNVEIALAALPTDQANELARAIRKRLLGDDEWEDAAQIALRWQDTTTERVEQLARQFAPRGFAHLDTDGPRPRYSPDTVALVERELRSRGHRRRP